MNANPTDTTLDLLNTSTEEVQRLRKELLDWKTAVGYIKLILKSTTDNLGNIEQPEGPT
jgi:hypothetical protein